MVDPATVLAQFTRELAAAEPETPSQQSIDDPWDALDFNEIAVDTGITDFAEHHDHYLYGTPKRS